MCPRGARRHGSSRPRPNLASLEDADQAAFGLYFANGVYGVVTVSSVRFGIWCGRFGHPAIKSQRHGIEEGNEG
jgi:hypothetical protein